MFRPLLTIAVAVWLSKPTLAIVESFNFDATLSSEKTSVPIADCWDFDLPGRIVTELEDCGISVNRMSERTGSDFRIHERARTLYGSSSIIFNRRMSLPVRRLDWRERLGVGISTSIELLGGDGAATTSTSITLVERLKPTVKPEFGPAILNLDILGEGFDSFSTANVKVFDHDTNELLLSWDKDDLFEPNNDIWFSQELNFDDRLGHAIRYELEAEGRILDGVARFAAVANLNVPEPEVHLLVLTSLIALGLLRTRTRRGSSDRKS